MGENVKLAGTDVNGHGRWNQKGHPTRDRPCPFHRHRWLLETSAAESAAIA